MEPQEVSIEDRLAAVFAKQEAPQEAPQASSPEDEAVPVEQESPPDGTEAESTEVEAQASPEEQPADDGEEVEYEGTTYKVPKELKEALLRQSDYTRKTQDVAKLRKAYEEQQQALQQERQFQAVAFDAAAEAKALEVQIKRFDGLDWTQLADSDPGEFLKLDRTYRTLKEQHSAKLQEAQQKWHEAQGAAQQRVQAQAAQAHEQLSREIKGWGKDLQAKLVESGTRDYGFTEAELAALVDPRMVKVLHDAHQYRALVAGRAEVAKKVQTAKPVTAPAARTSQTSAQNAKAVELQARLKKSGRPEDATALLAMRYARKVR